MKTGSTVTLPSSFLKNHAKIVPFILLNSTLPLSYFLTDSITSFDPHIGSDALWSGTKFIMMWNPLLVRSLSFAFKFSKSKTDKKYNFRAKEEMAHLMFSFPFVNPLNNIYNAFRLYRLEYGNGMGRFEPKNCEKVEQIGKEASSAGIFNSFLESGPQCVVQLKMISSTSSICFGQIGAVLTIFFVLAWASNRDYFNEPEEEKLDPDLDLKMVVVLLILPWLILIVIHSLITWMRIAAILGEFAFPCYLLFFLASYNF